jgi:hypothetical protein
MTGVVGVKPASYLAFACAPIQGYEQATGRGGEWEYTLKYPGFTVHTTTQDESDVSI